MTNTPLRPWVAFNILSVGVFMSTLDSSIVNVALPVIRNDFTAPLNLVGWIPLAYLLTITVTLLSFGRRGDRVGRARVYREGLLIFTAASLLCGLATHIELLIFARVIQALGASMIMAVGPALLTEIFPENMWGRAQGAMGIAVNVGLTSGPVLGGFITEALSWRYIFLINLPLGMLGWWFARRLEDRGFRSRQPSGRRGEIFQALIWALALTGIVLPLNRIPVWGAGFFPTGLCVLFGLATVAGFILLQHRNRDPILPLDLFRRRLFSIPLTGSTILFVYTFIVVYLGPFYLSILAGLPIHLVGAFFVLGPLGSLISAPIAGWLHDRWGSRGLTNTGLLINCATLFGLATLGPSPSLVRYGILMVALGIGNGIFMPPNTAALLGTAPRSQAGAASGLLATGRNFGMVLGVAIGSTIFELTYHRMAGGASLDDFDRLVHATAFAGAWQAAIWAGLGVCLFSLLLNIFRGREAWRQIEEAARQRGPGLGA